ncbi:MAG: DUF4440 domain-containing protein [Planctomycetes bacterium]|nr:DUF4440 domain-containing protein [Planctomycetota bacterium]
MFDRVLERYYDALCVGRWDNLAAQFWNDAHLSTVRPRGAGGPEEVVSISIAEYVAEAKRTVARTKPLEIERDAARVDVVGDVAHVVVEYRATDRSGDAPQVWRSVDFFTLVRHGEQWRIAALVFAPSVTTP